MPLRDDILAPIPGSNPAGENLEYAPLFDQIKEARREDDDAPQGDWARARKTADWKLVIQLAGDAVATQSKDLQLAAWLTEALLKRESFAGLNAGLKLMKALLDNFWDNLYPPKDDLDYRAMPIDWVGSRLNQAIKEAPLTKHGHGFFKYKESRDVGYEEEADNSQKQEARQKKLDDGKLAPEVFDKSFRETSKDFYQRAVENLDGALETAQALGTLCDEKFGDYSPTLVSLRETIEEVRHTANLLYQKKREEAGELNQPPPEEAEPEEVEETPGPVVVSVSSGAAAAPARVPAKKALAGLVPADKEELPARLTAIAKFLRDQDGYDPSPYLMLRGFRWGELRRDAPNPSLSLLAAPSTELRTQLKTAMLESDWAKVVEIGEAAMAEPCGRGWLDLQRYIVTALVQWSAPQIAAAIKSELCALLKDIPDLRRWTMMDDTPTANSETQGWLDEVLAESGAASAATAPTPVVMREEEHEQPHGEEAPPDSYELALDAIRQGRSKDAIEILATEANHQSTGRGRFRRKQQLAEVCIKLGQTAVAQPILEELLGEIDEHKLENWESSDAVAYPLTMLLDCLSKLDGDAAMRQKIYHRICRLDPVQALNCKP